MNKCRIIGNASGVFIRIYCEDAALRDSHQCLLAVKPKTPSNLQREVDEKKLHYVKVSMPPNEE